ncbi:LPP leucine zipper domain-containing protein [Vibrio mediterranei]|uniref:LPP leucine zipper domain-containing protein n=1 Tax=Vibrio mediterranei TaxID=689 RepID=UPI00148C781B|nr:hypothetical protein [Vibrio mediterranei]NOH31584.1 hypothetical protein [Vibrio mediterranei]
MRNCIKLLSVAAILALSGCASTETSEKIAMLDSQVAELQASVAALESDMLETKANSNAALSQSEATNQRVDGIVATYQK